MAHSQEQEIRSLPPTSPLQPLPLLLSLPCQQLLLQLRHWGFSNRRLCSDVAPHGSRLGLRCGGALLNLGACSLLLRLARLVGCGGAFGVRLGGGSERCAALVSSERTRAHASAGAPATRSLRSASLSALLFSACSARSTLSSSRLAAAALRRLASDLRMSDT
jgi:hypothetical protein